MLRASSPRESSIVATVKLSSRQTVLSTAFGQGWLANPLRRRLSFLVASAILALLCFFPHRYLAIVQLAPPEINAAGLQSVLGQLGGNYAALLGNNQPYDVNLTVAKSFRVEQDVLARAGLTGTPGYRTIGSARRKLERMAEVRSLRGGIFEFRVVAPDPDLALRLSSAYAKSFQERIGRLGLEQTAYKRKVLDDRMVEASARVSATQAALDRFRASNRLAVPDVQLGAAVGQLSSLQSELQGKRVALQSAIQFNTSENFAVKDLRAQIASLEGQIGELQTQAKAQGDLTVTGIARRSNEFANLTRDVQFAQSLYEAYSRYLEGSAVEEMSANWNVQVIEPAYVDPFYYINKVPAALLLAVVILAIGSEVYLLRPTVGSRGTIQRDPARIV